MIDFHTHSLLSDGELIPSELARRAEAKGYRAIGIADHVDSSNADVIIPRLAEVCRELRDVMDIEVIPGAEITHAPPELIESLVGRCRNLGAELIIIHGETLVEPVRDGTNEAALRADIDILAHPGLLTLAQAKTAATRGIFLELSSRKGHCLANGLVARLAIAARAKLIVGSDAHSPYELMTAADVARVVKGAGLGEDKLKQVRKNAEQLLRAIRQRRK